jgi:hypothetical protein
MAWAGSSDYSNNISSSIKRREIIGKMRNYELHKKDPAPRSELVI